MAPAARTFIAVAIQNRSLGMAFRFVPVLRYLRIASPLSVANDITLFRIRSRHSPDTIVRQ